MRTTRLICWFMAFALFVIWISPAVPAAPAGAAAVLRLVIGFLTGKGLDYVWDKVTGKPDIVELSKQIRVLEGIVGPTSEVAGLLAELRSNITPHMTRQQFNQMARGLEQRIAALEARQNITEQQIRKIHERIDDMERRTQVRTPPHQSQ